MTIEELKNNEELESQLDKELADKVKGGMNLFDAYADVFKSHGIEFDEDALKAKKVEMMELNADSLERVSGGTEWCALNFSCYYILRHDSNSSDVVCFDNNVCLMMFED